MQPMTTTPPQVDEKEETDKRRIPPVWIPATLCVGLLIAAIYLGGRIVSARQTSTVTRTAVPQAQSLPLPPVVQPVIAEAVKTEVKPELLTSLTKGSVTKSPATIPLINPEAGGLYLQLGAMNVEATHRFVQDLRSKNLEPHVAAGPTPGIMRVLIGPFDNRAALEERKAQLQTQGLNSFIRRY